MFKSYHPAGVNFVFGDASVHFIDETIDFQLYNCLGTRAGGEVVQVPYRLPKTGDVLERRREASGNRR